MLRFCRLRTHALYIGTTHFFSIFIVDAGLLSQEYLTKKICRRVFLLIFINSLYVLLYLWEVLHEKQHYSVNILSAFCQYSVSILSVFCQYSVSINQLRLAKLNIVFKLFSFKWWELEHKTKHILLTSYYLSSRYCLHLFRIQKLSQYPSHQW